MIKLTKNEAKTLEGIKDGLNVVQIAKVYQFAVETVRGHMQKLKKKKIIILVGKQSFFNKYELTGRLYQIENADHTPKIKHAFDPGEDKFLANAMKPLTEDQLFYLREHRMGKRSILAKKLGLTKLQLNFALDKLG